jgi:GNAT superfamily N-acetyltransferase
MTTADRPAGGPQLPLAVCRFADVTADEMEEWRRLQARAHPAGEERLGGELAWAKLEPTDYFIRLHADGDLRACAWLTRRAVVVDEREAEVAGVRGVMTDPGYRRRGFGRIVMERAHDLIRSLDDCEFALLFSSVMAVPFYESLGWHAVYGPVTCDQPGGRINYTERLPTALVMVRMKEDHTPPPSGAIDVLGLPW